MTNKPVSLACDALNFLFSERANDGIIPSS